METLTAAKPLLRPERLSAPDVRATHEPFAYLIATDTIDEGWGAGFSVTMNSWRWISSEFGYHIQRGKYRLEQFDVPGHILEQGIEGVVEQFELEGHDLLDGSRAAHRRLEHDDIAGGLAHVIEDGLQRRAAKIEAQRARAAGGGGGVGRRRICGRGCGCGVLRPHVRGERGDSEPHGRGKVRGFHGFIS